MLVSMKRLAVAGSIAVGAMLAATLAVSTQSLPSCDPDNGGIKLPAGFCALVVADNIGPARHLTVAPNGDVFAALQTTGGRERRRRAVAWSRSAIPTAMAVSRHRNGSAAGSITGIALRNGYLYVAQIQFNRAVQDGGWTAETGERHARDRRRRAYPASSSMETKELPSMGRADFT